MKSKLIAIAIGLALILGIVLIGGIRITRANELSNKVRVSRVLLVNQLDDVNLESQKSLVPRDLDRVGQHHTLLSTLDRNDLDGVELLDRLVNTRALRHHLNLGLLAEAL